MSNLYVDTIFTLLSIKQIFEKKKTASESRTQFWPRITPVHVRIFMFAYEPVPKKPVPDLGLSIFVIFSGIHIYHFLKNFADKGMISDILMRINS